MASVRTRRIAVLGCRSVGKSSISMRYTQNTFSDDYIPTLEDTTTKEVTFQGQVYRLEIADTAGQDTGSPASSSSLLNVDGWVLVFSTVSRASFEHARTLRSNLIASTGYKNLPMVLVGNKVDLTAQQEVPQAEATRLAQKWSCPLVFTSAKFNQNVEQVFEKCLLEVERGNGNVPDDKKCCVS